jgi:betaine reductase
MTSMAQAAGAIRILASGRIPHPTGDPNRTPEEEFAWRQSLLRRAVEVLSTSVSEASIFSS